MPTSNISVATSIGATGIAGAIVGICLYILSLFHINVPGDVASEIGVLVLAILHYIMNPKILSNARANGINVNPVEKA